MEPNYYEILGVEKSATADEIRAAYKEIARVYHPDSNFYDEIIDEGLPPEAMAKFKELTSAYNTLVNEEKRKLYNETLPPELEDWEAADLEATHDQWVETKARSTGVYAMGQFGNLDGKAVDVQESDIDETQILSVNEYEQFESPWYLKLWSKLVTMVYPRGAH